ncbi:hypothetical protein V493_06311 [Pseudogymnoascus sp. VKM F-4281 (FW-2241)]|nr:hypothetical protein V493_06311 [Pseudogymnoascus sp. VKM F-4281 (FW-2241)]
MKSSMDLDALTDEDLLICSPTVLGFSVKDKLWLEFAVAHISEIIRNESLFHQLAIPSEPKKLIEALITFQSGGEAKHTFDDFVDLAQSSSVRWVVQTLNPMPAVLLNHRSTGLRCE